MSSKICPFHAAFPVSDIAVSKEFYSSVLGCTLGRSSDSWIDINFFGHQLVFHYVKDFTIKNYVNPVDNQQIPVPHFGVVLTWSDWEKLASRLQKQAICFEISPYIRFKGQIGEQGTMFFYDPHNYALEFKSFKDSNQLFAS
ncbi:MAG: VOC family protein [bacterium]